MSSLTLSTTTTTTAKTMKSTRRGCGACPRCGDARPPVRRVPRIVAWMIIPVAWAAIIGFGSVLAIIVPLNLVLIPCWLMIATSLGALARELLDPQCAACGETRGAVAGATVAPPTHLSLVASNERLPDDDDDKDGEEAIEEATSRVTQTARAKSGANPASVSGGLTGGS